MLVEKYGRTTSVRTAEEIDNALKQELDALSPEEREVLSLVLEEMKRKQVEATDASSSPTMLDALSSSEYKHKPVGVEQFIKDPYFLGNTCDSLYPQYLDDLIELFEGGYNEAIWCLHPDTPIPLLDGTEKTIRELASGWEKNPQPFWVYGVDTSGKVVPAQAEFPRQTGVDDYYKVTLDDGTTFTGNARHQMVMRDGTKRMIRDMNTGDSIMPFITKRSSKSEGRRIEGYEMVMSLDTEEFRYTHALVEEDIRGPVDPKELTIHHKNFRKADNTPENLGRMRWKEHRELHHRHRLDYLEANPNVLAELKDRAEKSCRDPNSPLRVGHDRFVKSPRGRKVARANLARAENTQADLSRRGRNGSRSRWKDNSQRTAASLRMAKANREGNATKAVEARWKDPAQREAARQRMVARNKIGLLRRTDVTASAINELISRGAVTVAAVARALDCSKTRIFRALQDEGIDPKTVFTRRRNHFVVSIEKVGRGPVYCMTVPRTTNFAICTLNPDGSYARQGVYSSNTGAIGIGKSFVCSLGICRVLYEISCLHNPHKTFGLANDTNITLACFSVNEELATKVVFENIKTKITASPYFQENFSFKATKKELRFPHNVWVAPRATTDTSALGLNVISAFMDEGNFLPKRGKDMGVVDHADVIYSSLKRRMKSRFEKGGKLPGILFIASSKTTHEDFVSRRLKEAKYDPSIFVRDYALWEVKPEDYYSAETFKVLVGSEAIPSKILEDHEAESEEFLTRLPEDVLVIDVPEDFRHDFERDLEGSIKDIAGCSVVSVSPFIQRREKLQDAIDQDAVTYGPNRHIFSTLEHDPSKNGRFLWEKAVRPTNEQVYGHTYQQTLRPIINPGAMRHIHIDIGLRHDALGFCMAHVSGFKDVVRRTDRGEHLERAPIYTVDLMLRVVPPPGDEIILGDVRGLIYDLSAHGYIITSITTDSYQSTDMIQQLNQKGYNSRIVSVDTSIEPYENLKTAFYEDRIFIYDHPALFNELRTLQKDYKRRKIDHPQRGSKDCADALAGVVWTLSQLQLTAPLPMIRQSATSVDTWMPETYQNSLRAPTAPFSPSQDPPPSVVAPTHERYSVEEQWEPLPFFLGSGNGWSQR